MGAIIFISTFVSWALDNRMKWFLASLLMISISMFLVVQIIYYTSTGLQGYGEVDVWLPLPGVFLTVTAISSLVRKLNYSTSQGETETSR